MNQPRVRISLWSIIPLAILLGLSAMLLVRLENPRMAGSVDSPLVGRALPALGQEIKGPVIVNVFASWCAPCVIEHPFLLAAKSKGIRIIGVVYKDSQPNIEQYLKRMGNPYEMLIMDEDGTLGITLGITGVPENFAVDASGIVRSRLQGPFASVPDVLSFARME